jgi:DNA processing protein
LKSELLYHIALTLVPNIGNIHAKALINHFGSASSVFSAKKKELDHLEGVGPIRAKSIIEFTDFNRVEEELAFIEKYKIKALLPPDKDYPHRLLNCYDSPSVLYYRGTADLNNLKILGIVGTRNNNEYGRSICEKIIEDLNDETILIVSGLAFGIDTIAHKAALKNNMETVGVVGHGLDQIYPSQNKSLAKQMTEKGGILTEFVSKTKPDKQNFPIRNRLVAGMCDAIVVVESGIKGGSLITAELANGYNKEVFAIPGRTTDTKSAGCNYLIKTNKAALITSAADILENMGWGVRKKSAVNQRQLFIELTNEEKIIVDILNGTEQVHIDELYLKSNLSSSTVSAALLTLEMQGIVCSLPGKLYNMT